MEIRANLTWLLNCKFNVQGYNQPLGKNSECSIEKNLNYQKKNENFGGKFTQKDDWKLKSIL